jgi:hypothetical protein
VKEFTMLRLLNRRTFLTLAGLLVGIAGLVVQWIADPAKFAAARDTFGLPFPPGIAFIVAAGVLVLVTARWWWHAVFGALIGLWIVGAGSLANQLQPNFVSPNPGTVAGTVVMATGLVFGTVTGVLSMVSAFRVRRTARTTGTIPT